jgi:hypothetical protein
MLSGCPLETYSGVERPAFCRNVELALRRLRKTNNFPEFTAASVPRPANRPAPAG